MNNNDVKIGQRVREKFRDGPVFVVLDRHPSPASWWLQNAETGEIGHNMFDHARYLELVDEAVA